MRFSYGLHARSLHADAALLFEAGRYAGSHSLALLGFEELAKLQPLWSLTVDASVLAGTDWKYVREFMMKHNDKIALALFTEYLLEAIFSVDHHEDSIIKGLTPLTALTDEARRLNLLKQDGFYIGFDGSRFRSPNEVVTERMAASVVARLNSMLATFAVFDGLCSLPGPPTKEQLLAAKRSLQAERSQS